MSYNLKEFNFNSYQKNWINTAQHHNRHTSKEGAQFMTAVFWVLVGLFVICCLI